MTTLTPDYIFHRAPKENPCPMCGHYSGEECDMFGCGKKTHFVDATEMLHEVDRVLKMIDDAYSRSRKG